MPLAAEAQPVAKVPKVGMLVIATRKPHGSSTRLDELRALGYLRAATSYSNIALRTGRRNYFLAWRPRWSD